MSKSCPLTSGGAVGFYYDGDIPEVCRERCEPLWDKAIDDGIAEHEEYPDTILSDDACCPHSSSEYGNASLQAISLGSATRFYTVTERCTDCNKEIAESSYRFDCPNQ